MNETQIDLQLLRVFVTVAEEASFTKAARRLGIGKGTVSRQLTALEEALGVELLHRTTHQVALSTAGAALFERARPHLIGLTQALSALPERDEEPSGLLRLTAPSDFGVFVLPSVIADFSRRHPAVRFDVRLTGEQVDLVREGFDLAVRVVTGPLKDSSLTMRRLGPQHGGFYAAPSYLARRGRPRALGDDRHAWVMHPGAARVFKVAPEAIDYAVDDFALVRALLRAGLGVGLLPTFMVHDDLRAGTLEEVTLADLPVTPGELVLLYPSIEHVPRKVTAFRDFLVAALRADR